MLRVLWKTWALVPDSLNLTFLVYKMAKLVISDVHSV